MNEAVTESGNYGALYPHGTRPHFRYIQRLNNLLHYLLIAVLCVIAPAFLTTEAKATEQTTITFDKSLRETVTELPAVVGAKNIIQEALDERPVLVTFFASWCPPCLDEFLLLNAIHKKYDQSDLKIIAINVYEAWDNNDEARMDKFIQTTSPDFPAVIGNEAIRNRFGGINRIPTVYGFGKDGSLRYQFIHKQGSSKTNASLDELDQAARMLLGIGN